MDSNGACFIYHSLNQKPQLAAAALSFQHFILCFIILLNARKIGKIPDTDLKKKRMI